MVNEFCPNGNRWEDISFLFNRSGKHGYAYFFCDCQKCNGKIYSLRPRDITNQMKKKGFYDELAKSASDGIIYEQVKRLLDYENAPKILKFIKDNNI